MTFRKALWAGEQSLSLAHIEESKLDAWYLLAMICKIDKNYYYLHEEDELSEEQRLGYQTLIKKRAERIPLQYLTGEQEFMGFIFKVNSQVLIPRQDTETLVEEALKVIKPQMHVLDLCTGSGCIIISLAKLCPDIIASGADLSKSVLLTAKENARLNDIKMEIEWIRSDLFDGVTGKFHMIVCNPPYIPTEEIEELQPEVRDFEPMEALDGREDGLFFYRKIVQQAPEYLNPLGYLYFEIGHNQAQPVSELLQENHFTDIKVVKDLSGNDRVVTATYIGET
ncbi:MAG: peptide chain release factor N(5)-glutamine methyltransferase [Lachnospiraceae bacterium]